RPVLLPSNQTHTIQTTWTAFPARCQMLVRLFPVLHTQRPFLHNPRRRSPDLVRLLRRYYAAVRLPNAMHVGLIAHRFLPPARLLLAAGGNGASRFSRVEFLCMHGVYDSAGPLCTGIFSHTASCPSG